MNFSGNELEGELMNILLREVQKICAILQEMMKKDIVMLSEAILKM